MNDLMNWERLIWFVTTKSDVFTKEIKTRNLFKHSLEIEIMNSLNLTEELNYTNNLIKDLMILERLIWFVTTQSDVYSKEIKTRNHFKHSLDIEIINLLI